MTIFGGGFPSSTGWTTTCLQGIHRLHCLQSFSWLYGLQQHSTVDAVTYPPHMNTIVPPNIIPAVFNSGKQQASEQQYCIIPQQQLQQQQHSGIIIVI